MRSRAKADWGATMRSWWRSGLGCSLRETQRLLKLAGAAELYPKVRRDAIIIWCIDRGMSREACDDELWRFGEKTLLGTCPLQ